MFQSGAIFLVLLLPQSALAGKDQFRSGILASLSLITRYHLTIIWAIEELERKHKAKGSDRFYQDGYYYQMLVRKPAKINRRARPGPLALPKTRHLKRVRFPQTPEDLAKDIAGLRMSSPRYFWDGAPDIRSSQPGQKRIKTEYRESAKREEQQKNQQCQNSARQKQLEAGRLNSKLAFFIAMKSDDMSNPNAEPLSDSPDVCADSSSSPDVPSSGSPLLSSPGSPYTPHFLPYARKRSGKVEYDGFFVGDYCRAIERKSLSQKAYFGAEYKDQVSFYQSSNALARKDRTWDFLEIKFRVYDQPPAYQFGLKEEMLCNVYPIRGRYYELCAPYSMPFEASLVELSRSRYVPLSDVLPEPIYQRKVRQDQKVLDVLKEFEKTIHGQLENHFVAKGNRFRVDDEINAPETVSCIGRGQCAVVWQPGNYNLAFRRYAGHTGQSARQQAWVQQASYVIYEQLSVARDPEKGALKQEEDIGLVPPMSLASTRVYSRFEPLLSPDGSYSLYEIQPLIPQDELVEYYIDLLIRFGPERLVDIPLYLPLIYSNFKSPERKNVFLKDVVTLIMDKILLQLDVVTDNLSSYLESRASGSINIGIDPKVANYQVRFSNVSRTEGELELVAFLSNYDGYPPNLLLFSNEEDPEKSVLFKGGELYRLLDQYFQMYGFTRAFVGRTMKLNTLEKQVLKMLASIAGEIDSKHAPHLQESAKRAVLPFFLDIVNRWMSERAKKNNDSPFEPFDIDKIFAYQRDSALYHRAFRLHLLAAEIGSWVNPEKYPLPSAEFPVSDEQSQWLGQQRQRNTLVMAAFFAVDDVDGLQEFLMQQLNETHEVSQRVQGFLQSFQRLMDYQENQLNHLLEIQDYETLAETIRDAFESSGEPGEETVAHPLDGAFRRVASHEQCRFSRGCVYSAREHSLHHLLLRRMSVLRSMKFSGVRLDTNPVPKQNLELRDNQYWLDRIRTWNVHLQSKSTHSSRSNLFSELLHIPEARLTALFRNTYSRLKRRQSARIPEQEQLLDQLRVILEGLVNKPESPGTSGQSTRHQNSILLASLLLDRPFVWIIPPAKKGRLFQIERFQLEINTDRQPTMRVNQASLSARQLEQMLFREQATGVEHYYVMANQANNEWDILVPQGTDGPPVVLDNPEDEDDPLLNSLLNSSYKEKTRVKQTKKEGQIRPLSENEQQRRLHYNSELRALFSSSNFQRADTPSDHFCLLHALTVFLNHQGKNVTLESLKRTLRMFIAKLLLKVNLYPGDITLAEHQLIHQFGMTFLLDMLDELFLAQGGSGAHAPETVWGDFNLILLASVAFEVDIPFVNLNIDHWEDIAESTLQYNTAQHSGTVRPFAPDQPLPDLFIFFDEYPLDHWNLAYNPIMADEITPLFHWVDPLPASHQGPEDEMFMMDEMDLANLRSPGRSRPDCQQRSNLQSNENRMNLLGITSMFMLAANLKRLKK